MGIVWEATLDGKFDIKVVRDPEVSHIATLYIHHGSLKLFETPVTLSYNAAFGPDIDDIQEWMKTAAEWVDNSYKKPEETN